MTDAPEPEDFVSLYRHAFAEYGTHALWNKKMLDIQPPMTRLW